MIVAPPEAPQSDELEALIREARDRQRRRRRTAAAAIVAVAAASGLAIWAVVPGNKNTARTSRGSSRSLATLRRCPPGNLGTVAFVRGGALELLNLKGCRTQTLVRSRVRVPIAMSADGRWVAFRDGYVSAHGGAVHRTPGSPVWAPRTDSYAVVTRHGGLEVGRPGRPPRRLLPAGWGATTAVFSPDGRTLAVSRTVGRARLEEIWLLRLGTGSRKELFREPRREGAPTLLQGFSPGGRWLLFWKDLDSSVSILADGVPLLALPITGGRPRLVTGELYHDDYVSWCGGKLFYVIDHGGRDVVDGDGLAVAGSPSWRSTTVLPGAGRTSWTSFACSRAGTLAVAAGPSNANMARFGNERRAIWLVHGRSATRLSATLPPRHESDEWPQWSSDGRWLLFVRTRWTGRTWQGTLDAFDLTQNRLLGPIATVGATGNYYGYYGWSSQLSWHRP